jgi:xylulokinase
VLAPAPGEYVADGAARQAAWVLSGGPQPPAWSLGDVETYEAPAAPVIREQYASARDLTVNRPA